jgi:pyruvate,orthophosphate dikinase
VLLGLAVKGVVETSVVESGLEARVGGLAILQELRDEALVEDMDGYLYLTPEGEEAITRLCRGVVGERGEEAAIDLLAEFDRLDAELKSLATWWQTERGATADASVTAAVRLAELHDQLDRTTTKYAVLAPLLAPAVGGLDRARRAFLEGDEEMLTGATDESYHSRWFLLHELILRLAGKPRTT